MKEKIFFGTYGAGLSKGIYKGILDSNTGVINSVNLFSKIGTPTYLVVTKKHLLISIEKAGQYGGIVAFDLNESNERAPQHILSFNSAPVNLNLSPDEHLLFVSNYNTGFLQIYEISSDNRICFRDEIHNYGHGPLPQQESSHVHYAGLTPDGKLFVVDLGTDSIDFYDIDKNGHVLKKLSTFHTRPGFGPKKMIFRSNKQYAYILGELSNQIALVKFDSEKHELKQCEVYETIPGTCTKGSGCGGMHMSNNEKYLYVSNRGHDSIAVFKIHDSSNLEKVQSVSSFGKFPREFSIDLSSQYLIVGNHKSDNVVVFDIDEKTGLLALRDKKMEIPEVVSIVFIN